MKPSALPHARADRAPSVRPAFAARSRRSIGRAAALLAVLVLALTALPSLALAAQGDESAGDSFRAEASGDQIRLGADFLLNDPSASGDLLVAGRNVSITGGQVDGNVRAVGQALTIDGVRAGRNVSVAGQSVTFSDGSEAQGLYAAGQTITVRGTSQTVTAYGQDVVIDGEVRGDVFVSAETLRIGQHAKIIGTLTAELPQGVQPTKEEGADVGSLQVKQVAQPAAEKTAAQAVVSVLLAIAGGAVCALLVALALPKAVEAHLRTFRTRPGQTIGWGLASLVLGLIVFAVLACIPLTTALGVAGLGSWFTLLMAGTPFIGAAAGQFFLPRMNRLLSALLCGAIVGALVAIPYVGGVAVVFCYALLAGGLIQLAWLAAREGKKGSGPSAASSLPAA